MYINWGDFCLTFPELNNQGTLQSLTQQLYFYLKKKPWYFEISFSEHFLVYNTTKTFDSGFLHMIHMCVFFDLNKFQKDEDEHIRLENS